VHKRLHAAQAKEFQLLVKCFEENPESFWQSSTASAFPWDEENFLRALKNVDLVPQADPNTASHGQRVMKIMALKQLQAASPTMYDPLAIDTAALKAIGWSNPQQFFASAQAQAQVPPDLQKAQQELAVKKEVADSTAQLNQAKVQEIQAKIQQGAYAPKTPAPGAQPAPPQDTQADLITAQAKMVDAQTKAQSLGIKKQEMAVDDENRDSDRQSRERVQLIELAKDIMLHPEEAKDGAKDVGRIEKQIGIKKGD
jgi:anti-sigma28 factor (negative regulator of flagellin synthesis)